MFLNTEQNCFTPGRELCCFKTHFYVRLPIMARHHNFDFFSFRRHRCQCMVILQFESIQRAAPQLQGYLQGDSEAEEDTVS